MPLSEQAKRNKKRYDAEYTREHLKRIPLNVQLSEYEQIRAAAGAAKESVNGYIKESVRRRMASEGITGPPDREDQETK